MNILPLRKAQINPSSQATGPKMVKGNLSGRFSAEPLKNISTHQDVRKSQIATPSTYERNVQIAKVASAVVGLAVGVFAAYWYLSKPYEHCEDHLLNRFTGTAPKCIFEDGSMYQGEWDDGEFSGDGSYTNLLGERFTGTFYENRFAHETREVPTTELNECRWKGLTDCVIALRNRDCDFLEYQHSRKVDCKFSNGAKYNGFVEYRKFQGSGDYTNPAGKIFSGKFQNGFFVDDNYGISLSELNQCSPEGLTDCVIALRNQNCGTIDGRYIGEVDCKFGNGAKYKGHVVAGLFSGDGHYTSPAGKTFSGQFRNNGLLHKEDWLHIDGLNKCNPQEELDDCVDRVRKAARSVNSDHDGSVWEG